MMSGDPALKDYTGQKNRRRKQPAKKGDHNHKPLSLSQQFAERHRMGEQKEALKGGRRVSTLTQIAENQKILEEASKTSQPSTSVPKEGGGRRRARRGSLKVSLNRTGPLERSNTHGSSLAKAENDEKNPKPKRGGERRSSITRKSLNTTPSYTDAAAFDRAKITPSVSVAMHRDKENKKLADVVVKAESAKSTTNRNEPVSQERRGSFVVITTEDGEKCYSHEGKAQRQGLKVAVSESDQQSGGEKGPNWRRSSLTKKRGSITEQRSGSATRRAKRGSVVEKRGSIITSSPAVADKGGAAAPPPSNKTPSNKPPSNKRVHRRHRGTGTDEFDVAKILSMEQLRHILQRVPEERSEEDINVIYDLITETTSVQARSTHFILQLPSNVRREVMKHMSIVSLPSHTILFRQGDKGDAFYMIIRGKVGVWVKTANDAEHQSLGMHVVLLLAHSLFYLPITFSPCVACSGYTVVPSSMQI
jgi:hypothetical protein